MKVCFITGFMVVLFLALTVYLAIAQQEFSQQRPEYVFNEVIITFDRKANTADIAQLRQQYGMLTQSFSPMDSTEVVTLPEGVDPKVVVNELKGHPLVKQIDLNHIGYFQSLPDDSLLPANGGGVQRNPTDGLAEVMLAGRNYGNVLTL